MDGSPASAEQLMLRGEKHILDQGIDAVFIGMVGIEGRWDVSDRESIDPHSPIGAMARPWFHGMADVDDAPIDGLLTTWTSVYVAEDGTYYAPVIPSGNGGVGQLSYGGSEGEAIGGLRACQGQPTRWRVGSDEAMQAARAEPTFAQAVLARPGQTMISILWMGPQPTLGCGATGGPYWWIGYGDLAGSLAAPVPMMVATVDATTGDVLVAQEWLRLRPAATVSLFDRAIEAPGTAPVIVALGDVDRLAESASLVVTGPSVRADMYDLKLIGPDTSYPLGPFGLTGAEASLDALMPAAGSWSLEVAPRNAQALPATFQVTFTAKQ